MIGFPQAADAELVERLTAIINAAYHHGEAGIWLDGWNRIEPAAVARLIERRELAVAYRDGVPVGCVRVRRLDERTAELGLLSVAPEAHGQGLGRELLAFAERVHGTEEMALELLVPRHDPPHPHKQRLHEWYSRLGYAETARREFNEPLLAGPADMRTYRKRLRS
jgi:GNAT superfamily N-acetyltransferase